MGRLDDDLVVDVDVEMIGVFKLAWPAANSASKDSLSQQLQDPRLAVRLQIRSCLATLAVKHWLPLLEDRLLGLLVDLQDAARKPSARCRGRPGWRAIFLALLSTSACDAAICVDGPVFSRNHDRKTQLAAPSKRRLLRLCLDPGHGGENVARDDMPRSHARHRKIKALAQDSRGPFAGPLNLRSRSAN